MFECPADVWMSVADEYVRLYASQFCNKEKQQNYSRPDRQAVYSKFKSPTHIAEFEPGIRQD